MFSSKATPTSKHTHDILSKLRRLDTNTQLELWRGMLDDHPFNLNQLRFLRTAIDDRIKLDIISGVPYEVALYIMSFLSPEDLGQAAQTCRSWRTVCEDNRLWREKCKEEGLLDDEVTLDTIFKSRIIATHIKQEKFVVETLSASQSTTKLSKSNWKIAYLKHVSILRNWQTRNFVISEPFISEPPTQPSDQSFDDDRQQHQEQSQLAPPANAPTVDQPKLNSPTIVTRSSAKRAGHPQPEFISLPLKRRNCSRFNNDSSNSTSGSLYSSVSNNNSSADNSNNSNGDICDDINNNRNNTVNNLSVSDGRALCRSYMMQLRCHEENVITCLQYNPRTSTIVSGSDDQTLKVWSSETGRCISTLEGHTGGVWSSQLSPEDIVISGSTDRTLRVWEAHTGVLMHTLFGHTSTVRCLALDGNYVVSGSRDTTLRLWDITKGVCKHVFHGHSQAVRCVEYKNDIIVSGAYDNLVMVWNALSGTCCHTLANHVNKIYSLQLDGKTIASGSLDSTICIWDVAAGKLRHCLKGHTSLTSKMQLKGDLLVSANADSLCKVWNINTGQCLQTLGKGDEKHTSAITSVYFNNRHVVTSSDDGTVKLWDIKTGEFIRNLVVLPTAGQGGVVWRIRASYTKLICAAGSRTQAEDTHLLVLDFNE